MSIRVAIAGVGNCASSLVQGVEYYKDTKDEDKIPGLMHNNFGGYRVRDIESGCGGAAWPDQRRFGRVLPSDDYGVGHRAGGCGAGAA